MPSPKLKDEKVSSQKIKNKHQLQGMGTRWIFKTSFSALYTNTNINNTKEKIINEVHQMPNSYKQERVSVTKYKPKDILLFLS